MEDNYALNEYCRLFDEMPPMIMTVSYSNPSYQVALDWAIAHKTKLTYENIGKFFKNNYDLVDNNEEKPKGEEPDMEQEKIRKLLKTYGAEDNEIENFIHDLYEDMEEAKEEDGEVDKFDSREIILKNLKKDFNFDNDEDLQKLVLNKLGK